MAREIDPIRWDERSLTARMRHAFDAGDLEAPNGIAHRALEGARQRARQRRAARRTCVASVSSLAIGLTLALLTLNVPPYADDSEMPELRHGKITSGWPHGRRARKSFQVTQAMAKTERGVRDRRSRVDTSAMRRRNNNIVARAAPPRRERPEMSSVQTNVLTVAATTKVEQPALETLAMTQAEEFTEVAQMLEQAGQVEPAYRFYAMSVEAVPTPDAAFGAVRTLKRMDEAMMSGG